MDVYIIMSKMIRRLPLALQLLLAFCTALAAAASSQEPLVDKPRYKLGEAIPVSCLNRTS